MMRNSTICLIALAVAGVAHAAEGKSPTKGAGRELYRDHCAVCHGVDGKGAGPAAAVLKRRPADLTLLRRKNGGDFPAARVRRSIDGTAPGHAGREMPKWGQLLDASSADPGAAASRVEALAKYVESIQAR